jgi:hypothetical protein
MGIDPPYTPEKPSSYTLFVMSLPIHNSGNYDK